MAAADYRMMTDATGQDLVAALQNIAPLQVAPLVVSIPTGQWSGSGNDYYITVNASNVSVNSILVPCYDADSRSRLNGPVWCVPAAGSFTIHTSAIPSGTVTILVQFPGVMGEAQYQVLADVYSKSQAVAKADIVNNLTSTATDKPASANLVNGITSGSFSLPSGYSVAGHGAIYRVGHIVTFSCALLIPAWTSKVLTGISLIPEGFRPNMEIDFAGTDNTNETHLSCLLNTGGNLSIYRAITTSCTSIRLYATYIA